MVYHSSLVRIVTLCTGTAVHTYMCVFASIEGLVVPGILFCDHGLDIREMS